MQTKTTSLPKLLRNSLLLIGCFAMLHSASSATFSTGGGKNKNAKKAPVTTLSLKNSPLSFNNGYRFRSGLSFSTNSSNTLVMHGNSIRFQKGNSLYVLPVKQKVIFTKFKTPQKENR